jgi:AP-3 complex subunit delta-1
MMIWSPEQQTMASLLLARIVHFLEPFATHANLEVQERAVEFLELFKLASDAVKQESSETDGAPVLITTIIPSLFSGAELGPVAASAQRKVPLPENMDLSVPLNASLSTILQKAEQEHLASSEFASSYEFYYEKPTSQLGPTPAAASLLSSSVGSYQQDERGFDDPRARAAMQAARRQRKRDDPFYIEHEGDDTNGRESTPDVLRAHNIEELDVDAIPIMDLNLEEEARKPADAQTAPSRQRHRKKISIAAEETIGDERLAPRSRPLSSDSREGLTRGRPTQGLLQVDSSGLRNLSLTGEDHGDQAEIAESTDEQMAKAAAEVERLRLEMQRASEQLQLAEGIPEDGTVVKKKKKKKVKKSADVEDNAALGEGVEGTTQPVKKKKKKKKAPVEQQEVQPEE